jgi:rod shape-determining protein MreD
MSSLRLVTVCVLLAGLRYLALPDLITGLDLEAKIPILSHLMHMELVMLLVLYLALRVNTRTALSTAFFMGLLADTLIVKTLGVSSLIFLIVAILPEYFSRYILVRGLMPSLVILLIGLTTQTFLTPIFEADSIGLISMLQMRFFWIQYAAILIINCIILVPAIFVFDIIFNTGKTKEKET